MSKNDLFFDLVFSKKDFRTAHSLHHHLYLAIAHALKFYINMLMLGSSTASGDFRHILCMKADALRALEFCLELENKTIRNV